MKKNIVILFIGTLLLFASCFVGFSNMVIAGEAENDLKTGSDSLKNKNITATDIYELTSKSVVIVLAYDDAGELLSFGSGVVLSTGEVATNCHVIEKGEKFFVRYQKKRYQASLHYTDWGRDICSLAVDGLKAPPVNFGRTDNLKVGERVYAIGAPQGLELTFTEGIVSNLRKTKNGRYIQTTAPIAPGSSGGGLFDKKGQLIGLTSFYVVDGQNLNFALPVEWIKELPNFHEDRQREKNTEHDYFTKALALIKNGDWRHLLKHSTRWTEAMPDSYLAWFHLGVAFAGNERTDKAIEAYERAVNINPECSNSWNNLGNEYYVSGQIGQAIDAYKRAALISPNNDEIWYNLGLTYGKRKQISEAVEAYKKAISINPKHKKAWTNLGVAYVKSEKPIKAINAYQEVVNIDPQDVVVWYNLGLQYGELGLTDRAVEAYQEALNVNPNFIEARNALGVEYSKAGEIDRAVETFRGALKIDPQHINTLFNLGTAYYQANNTKGVIDVYQRLSEIDGAIAEEFYNRVIK